MSTLVDSAAPTAAETARRRPRTTAAKRRQYGAAYALVMPFFVIFIAMMIIPLVYAGYLSLFKQQLIGGASFAGLGNYARALTDPLFLTGILRMGIFLVIQVPIMLALALFFALALDSGMMKLAKFTRLSIFVPYAVPGVVATLMWGYLYGPDFGPFAQITTALGLRTSAVLHAERHAVLDHEHRELGVHRLQHDHLVRGAALDPDRAVRGGPG